MESITPDMKKRKEDHRIVRQRIIIPIIIDAYVYLFISIDIWKKLFVSTGVAWDATKITGKLPE